MLLSKGAWFGLFIILLPLYYLGWSVLRLFIEERSAALLMLLGLGGIIFYVHSRRQKSRAASLIAVKKNAEPELLPLARCEHLVKAVQNAPDDATARRLAREGCTLCEQMVSSGAALPQYRRHWIGFLNSLAALEQDESARRELLRQAATIAAEAAGDPAAAPGQTAAADFQNIFYLK